jgi:hypothetical protein
MYIDIMTAQTYLQIVVKLFQHQTHATHQAVHVSSLSSLARLRQCPLVRLKVRHPLYCKVVRRDVNLVEDEQEGQASFVHDPASSACSASLKGNGSYAYEQA